MATCERALRRYGLPLLVEHHSARRDVFGRAAPLLLVLLLFGLVGAINLDWTPWQNVLAVVLGAVVVAACYAGVNVLRGRRWTALPQDIGGPELAFFVLAPAVLPLLSGAQWRDALSTALGNVVILAVIWVVVRYGIHSTIWWGLRGGIREIGGSLLRLVRFLPLLLIFSMALFYNTEVWQVFDHTPGVSDFILGGFFALLIAAILRIRLTAETSQILSVAEQPGADEGVPPEPPPDLTRTQRSNVTVMVAFNQFQQVVTVSLAVGLFFFALGALTITQGVMSAWSIEGGGWVEEIHIAGETDLRISQTLLRVSVALATFTGLYYAISVLTDSLYRDDFIDDMAAKMRDINAQRARYHAALAQLEHELSTREDSDADRPGRRRRGAAAGPSV